MTGAEAMLWHLLLGADVRGLAAEVAGKAEFAERESEKPALIAKGMPFGFYNLLAWAAGTEG